MRSRKRMVQAVTALSALLLGLMIVAVPWASGHAFWHTFELQVSFHGTMGFYSPNWSDLTEPLWILVPQAAHDHQAKLVIPASLVDLNTSTPPDGHILGQFVYYDLAGEQVDFQMTDDFSSFHKTYQLPSQPRPCNAGCGNPGSDEFRRRYKYQRNTFNWLASVERLAPRNGTVEYQLKPDLLVDGATAASHLQARFRFSTGEFLTHMIAGEVSSDEMNPRKHTKFQIAYRQNANTDNRPPLPFALTGSMTAIFEIGGVDILTKNLQSGDLVKRIVMLSPQPGQMAEIFITNLRNLSAKQTESVAYEVEHFRMLYPLLEGVQSNDTANWEVPKVLGPWPRSGSVGSGKLRLAGDEACPPGCFNCR